jgi:hypothetical protein
MYTSSWLVSDRVDTSNHELQNESQTPDPQNLVQCKTKSMSIAKCDAKGSESSVETKLQAGNWRVVVTAAVWWYCW